MGVSREEARAVARLARLRLTDDDVERFTVQLSRILEHVDVLSELDAEGVDEMPGAAEGAAPLRGEDAAPDALERPIASFAPEVRDGFITVPRLAALGGDDSDGSEAGRAGDGGAPGSGTGQANGDAPGPGAGT